MTQELYEKDIPILPYNKVPCGVVEYYGDVETLYVNELKNTYETVLLNPPEISDTLQRDVFINRGFPNWLYSLESEHKVIGIKKVLYSDEDDEPDSNMPVNDLRQDRITHYLF